MKKQVGVVLGTAFAIAWQAVAGNVVDIKNAAFERTESDGYPSGWSRGANWHGERSGHNGSGGIVYETDKVPVEGRQHVRQKVALRPGKRYRFSGLVKTKDLAIERKTNALGITVYISGFNAQGKQVFGAAAKPFVQGTRDWVKVEGITSEIPDDVVDV